MHDGDFPRVQHPGPPDQPEVPRDHPGNPFPKRDGPWETAGGKEYYSGPQPGLGLYSPSRGFLFYTSEVIYRKSITIVIRTPDRRSKNHTIGFRPYASRDRAVEPA